VGFKFKVAACTDLCKATYSSLENHPRLIRARDNKPVPKIVLDPRTGVPIVPDQTNVKPPKDRWPPVDSILEADDEDDQRKSRCSLFLAT